MGWHVRDITRKCQGAACSSRATVALYNSRNELHGYFCRRCGQSEAKRREREDKKRRERLGELGIDQPPA